MFSSKKNDSYKPYLEKISTGKTLDNDMTELFLGRIAAFTNLASPNKSDAEIAKKFLLDTMSQSEKEYNFPAKLEFIKNVSLFAIPTILAKKCDDSICAIVYKIDYRYQDVDDVLHEISFFSKTTDGKFKYTHKYDLAALYQRFCKDTNEPLIRQIGDSVLHKEAKTVIGFKDENLIEIERQIDILKKTLTNTGGVGIAANQCADIIEPLKIILSGVDYNEPEHVIKAITRYPTVLFPQMKICINPKIVEMDVKCDDFAEGCLSVHGIFRGIVSRPKTVLVRYQNTKGLTYEDSFSGTDARVMLHELDHILNGKVYIQRIIDELSINQCEQITDVIDSIISAETSPKFTNPFLSPTVLFERENDGRVIFDIDKVRGCFKETRRDVLKSIYTILKERITSHTVSSLSANILH